jgi:NADH:ubiquinone oxidoreductase subunit 4 (subunit M)
VGLRAGVHRDPDKQENKVLKDLSGREIALMAPLVILIIVLGLYPKILLDRTAASTEAVLDRIEAVTDFEVPEPGRLADVYVAADAEEGE